jgi:hypothetical protein
MASKGKSPGLTGFFEGSVLKVEMSILDKQSKGIAIDE